MDPTVLRQIEAAAAQDRLDLFSQIPLTEDLVAWILVNKDLEDFAWSLVEKQHPLLTPELLEKAFIKIFWSTHNVLAGLFISSTLATPNMFRQVFMDETPTKIKDNLWLIKTKALSNPECPLQFLQQYSQELIYRDAVLSNPSCPPALLTSLFTDHNLAYKSIVKNPNCPLSLLQRALDLQRDYAEVSADVLANPQYFPMLQQLGWLTLPHSPQLRQSDTYYFFVSRIAANPLVSTTFLSWIWQQRHLMSQPEQERCLNNLVSNPQSSPALLLHVLLDPQLCSAFALRVLENPNVNYKVLVAGALLPDHYLRGQALLHPLAHQYMLGSKIFMPLFD